MHSWRILILPFIEQKTLYDAYNFDQPWDGPDNAKLSLIDVPVFRRPEAAQAPTPMTSFVAVVGPEAAFTGPMPGTFEDIADGTSKTVMFVEIVGSDIRWTEPRDLPFAACNFKINDGSGRGIGSPYGGARVASADGSIRTLPDSTPPERLRALLTARGGEPIPDDW